MVFPHMVFTENLAWKLKNTVCKHEAKKGFGDEIPERVWAAAQRIPAFADNGYKEKES